jgi:hypothetical protein
MHFSETEIEQLTAKYKERLQESAKKLPKTAPTLSELQEWMQDNLLENREVLALAIEKMGKGENVKKMPEMRVRKEVKKSRIT